MDCVSHYIDAFVRETLTPIKVDHELAVECIDPDSADTINDKTLTANLALLGRPDQMGEWVHERQWLSL